jgi:NDP-sugar pyrophosphorylase family protein
MPNLTAIVLAGGRGSRMKPYDGPKCMIPVKGKFLIDHTLEHLREYVQKIIVCTGYHAEHVEAHVEKSKCAVSRLPAEATMIDRILACGLKALDGDTLICYGDTFADVDIRALLKAHRKMGKPFTVTAYRMKSNFGIVDFNKRNEATSFREKPLLEYWHSIGYIVMSGGGWKELNPSEGLGNLMSRLAEQRKLSVYKHEGKHWTVNTMADLNELEESRRES